MSDRLVCSICLDCIHAQDKAVLPCRHAFHRDCLRKLRQHGVDDACFCPLCRTPLPLLLGSRVVLTGLSSLPELNGTSGTVVAECGNSRWGVQVDGQKKVISVASKNLAPSGLPVVDAPLMGTEELMELGRMEAESGVRAGDPSSNGTAKDCLHGGPRPQGTVLDFFQALCGCLGAMREVKHGALAAAEAGRTSTQSLVGVETDVLFRFWSRPGMSCLIKSESFKVSFSCAADAVIDSDFDNARHWVRLGAFVRMWAQHGGAQMLADWKLTTAPGVLGRQIRDRWAGWETCLRKTRTDRGVLLYLASAVPCHCLDGLKTEMERQPRTGKCDSLRCQKQLPASDMSQCSRCRAAQYCGRKCQQAAWKEGHKHKCRLWVPPVSEQADSAATGPPIPGPAPALREGETVLCNGEDLTYRQLYQKIGQGECGQGGWFGETNSPLTNLGAMPLHAAHPWIIGCDSCGSTSRGNKFQMLQSPRGKWECLGCFTNAFVAMKKAQQ
jgi:hypothetical protein